MRQETDGVLLESYLIYEPEHQVDQCGLLASQLIRSGRWGIQVEMGEDDLLFRLWHFCNLGQISKIKSFSLAIWFDYDLYRRPRGSRMSRPYWAPWTLTRSTSPSWREEVTGHTALSPSGYYTQSTMQQKKSARKKNKFFSLDLFFGFFCIISRFKAFKVV